MEDLLRRSSLVVAVVLTVACGDSGDGGAGGGTGGEQAQGGAGGEPAEGGAPGTGGAPSEGGGGSGEGGAAPGTPCEEICAFLDSLEEEIMCGYDGSNCVVNCDNGFAQTPEDCHDEAIAYNDCLMMQPADDFNCTNMTFTLEGGACDEAYDALAACVGG